MNHGLWVRAFSRRRVLAAVLAVALSACESTEPETFPNLIGSYTLDALFRDALASDVRARGTISFTHVDPSTGSLIGDADVQLTVTGQPPLRLVGLERATVTRDGEITFRLHLPDLVGEWRFTGSVSSSSQTMTGNHSLSTAEGEFLGTWTAGRI